MEWECGAGDRDGENGRVQFFTAENGREQRCGEEGGEKGRDCSGKTGIRGMEKIKGNKTKGNKRE